MRTRGTPHTTPVRLVGQPGVGTRMVPHALAASGSVRAEQSATTRQATVEFTARTPRPDLTRAINAHYTNTPRELAAALSSPANWLEGDIRMSAGTPVMAHQSWDVGRGYTTREWLQIVARSGRYIKMDIKNPEAIEPIIALLREFGIPDHRLMFNITMTGSRLRNTSVQEAQSIRRRFPGSVICLSTDEASYSPYLLRRLGEFARALGGTTQIILRWDLIGPNTIRIVQSYTNLGIWNAPIIASPSDIAAETARLRALGVSGTIDLR